MRFLAESLLVTAAVLFIAAGCAMQPADPVAGNGVQNDFTLYDLEGESVVLSGLLEQEKKVILAFWTTWCAYCVQAVPRIQEFYERHGGEATLVSINIRESESAVRRFAADRGISYRIALDRDGSVAKKFNVIGVPTYKVMEPDGEIIFSGNDFGSAAAAAGF